MAPRQPGRSEAAQQSLAALRTAAARPSGRQAPATPRLLRSSAACLAPMPAGPAQAGSTANPGRSRPSSFDEVTDPAEVAEDLVTLVS